MAEIYLRDKPSYWFWQKKNYKDYKCKVLWWGTAKNGIVRVFDDNSKLVDYYPMYKATIQKAENYLWWLGNSNTPPKDKKYE